MLTDDALAEMRMLVTATAPGARRALPVYGFDKIPDWPHQRWVVPDGASRPVALAETDEAEFLAHGPRLMAELLIEVERLRKVEAAAKAYLAAHRELSYIYGDDSYPSNVGEVRERVRQARDALRRAVEGSDAVEPQ